MTSSASVEGSTFVLPSSLSVCLKVASISSNMDAYVYEDLPAPGAGEQDIHIRLLKLVPGKKTDQVSCTISIHSLANPPAYEAISYSWGHPDDKTDIKCEGGLITVPNNLNDFLSRTQAKGKERTMWIDSICINQGSPEEKNSQVAAMRHIYKKAKFTVIWLGKEEQDSMLGVNFAKECCEKYRRHLAGEKDEKAAKKPWYRLKAYEEFQTVFDPKWGAFFNLFDRAYWSRAWVVQEVVVSSNSWVVCGDDMISWNTLLYALVYIMTLEIWICEFYGSQNLSQLVAMQISLNEVVNYVKPAHYKVLLRHRASLATDARDKIFAYYGISAHTSLRDHDIKPDYTLTTKELFTNIAVSTLRAATSLEFLDVPRLSRDNELGLPSWVPNWEAETSIIHSSLLQLEFKPAEESNDYYRATKASEFTPIIDETLTRLELSGYTVDRIVRVTNEWIVQDTTGYSSISKQARILQKNQGFVHEWETVLGYFSGAPYPSGEKSRTEVLWQTCVAGVFPTGKDEARKSYHKFEGRQYWLRMIQTLHLSSFILPWLIVVLIGHFLRTIGIPNPEIPFRSLTSGMINRKAMETVEGYVGLVPRLAEVGDYIVLAKGGRLPLVLRPKGKEWEFIGDCYVHGMMDGELWDEEEGKKGRCEKIVLV